MKTLKKDGINEALLLKTYAYICGHQKVWNQGSWRTVEDGNRCRTSMCFAGHAAITLSPSRDVVPVPKPEVWKAVNADKATEEQIRLMDDWQFFEDQLLATPAEIRLGLHQVHTPDSTGKPVKTVCIMDRAERLLGQHALGAQRGREWELFMGENSIERIRRIIANALEITPDEVDSRARAIAKENHWRFPREVNSDTVPRS